jgi:hypothetical protein
MDASGILDKVGKEKEYHIYVLLTAFRCVPKQKIDVHRSRSEVEAEELVLHSFPWLSSFTVDRIKGALIIAIAPVLIKMLQHFDISQGFIMTPAQLFS